MTVFSFAALSSSLLLLTRGSEAFAISKSLSSVASPLSPVVAISSSSRTIRTTTALNSATSASSNKMPTMKVAAKDCYSPQQLKDALNSLLDDSEDPTFDGRHIYGYGDDTHELSMLQTITATVLLDYQTYMKDLSAIPSQDDLITQAKSFAEEHGPMLNLQTVIANQAPRMALAAEFKRASPSKGNIATHLNAGDQAAKYTAAGANVISVLTEPHWFQGSLDDLKEVRLATNGDTRPAILRKEFIVNEYMIAEAAAFGADTVLLIVAVLPQHLLKRLIDYCRSVGMEALVEVHADDELQVALAAGATVIGVNNRNLHTFQMDLGTTQHVAQLLDVENKVYAHGNPDADYTVCALSGMSTSMDVDRYRQTGVGMVLIGESLMRATDPQKAIADLCLDPAEYEAQQAAGGGAGGAYTRGTQVLKVCGITNADDALVACQAGANLIGVIFAPKSKRCVSTEQAKEVVDAVRTFGERRSVMGVDMPAKEQAPLPHLVNMAQRLENASRRPMVVGVFQNQDPEFIQQMVADCGLDMVQLHGKEGMEACSTTGGVPTIRVVDIETDVDTGKASSTAVEDLLQALTNDPAAILLDTSIKGAKEGGGTGVTFDWSIAERIQNAGLPVIIAGGLTPDNVKDAVTSVRPWGIDVSSGVESPTPGTKDHEKVKAFVKGAKEAAVESSKGF